MLDGELAVPAGRAFSFDALLQRIHPAASRVRRLAVETPVLFIVFDLLVGADGRALTGKPLSERRRELESFYKNTAAVRRPAALPGDHAARRRRTLAQARRRDARRRHRQTARSSVQLRRSQRHAEDQELPQRRLRGRRLSLQRRQPARRLAAARPLRRDGLLHHVGFTSTIKREDKPALTKKLKALIAPPGFTGNAPGGPSRWSTERSGEWEPLKPKLVVEVCYDHFSGGRFRHGTRLLRWRPDKTPRQCTLDQVRQKKANLMALLG